MMLRQRSNDKKLSADIKNTTPTTLTITTLATPPLAITQHFDQHNDDSSDDDEVLQKISHHDIKKSWKRMEGKSDTVFTGNLFLKNDELLSFVVHAAGIKLLYSSSVNQLYYPLKNTVLSESKSDKKPSSQLLSLAKNACLTAYDKAFSSLETFLTHSNHTSSTPHKIINHSKIKDAFTADLEKFLTNEITTLIQWLKNNKHAKADKKPNEFILFENKINALFFTLLKQHFSINDDKHSINRKQIHDELFKLAIITFTSISTELEFNELSQLAGKIAASKALATYQTRYQNVLCEMKRLLDESYARGYVHSMLSKKIESHKALFLKAYIKDLLHIKMTHQKKTILSTAEKSVLDKYLVSDNTAIHDELTRSFALELTSLLEHNIKSFHRPTLGKSYLFSSSNPYQFLANLRLSNRSQKRLALNLKEAVFKSGTVSRRWRLSEACQADADVLETQQITSAFGRKDIIEDVGNYEKVNAAIDQLKTYFERRSQPLTDACIATWIRELFLGSIPDYNLPKIDHITITHKLQALTYLLFGCEATRNPAMHIINQMLLDLIIHNKKWTFAEAFTHDKKMPMAPEGAVAVARRLESKYRLFMPYPYFYHGIEEDACKESQFHRKDLANREAQIFREWLILYKGINDKVTKQNAAEWLLKKIEDKLDHWLCPQPKMTKDVKDLKK